LSYVRVSIQGVLFNSEVWSVNPVFDPTGEFPGGVNQVALDTAALAIANRTLPTGLRNMLSTSGNRNGARVEVRDDVTDDLIAISVQGSSTVLVGLTTPVLTAQSAVVCSIRTDSPGGSGRGRFYWPALGASVSTQGRLANPSNAALATDFKAYLLGIRSDLAAAFPTIGFDLAVRSKATKTTPHAVRLQVGDIIDTQRRRRDALPESYTQIAFP